MATFTQFLKLYKPVANEVGWDDNMNSNLDLIDGFVHQFLLVPGFVGAWANSTTYAVGNIVLDITTGALYRAQVAHTSSALPTTFAQERAGLPNTWVLSNNAAQDSAVQAAQSAAQSAASATAAASSATAAAASASQSAGALQRSGGTMTGPLTLFRDPLGNLEATTKQYVDAHIGGAGFLPLSGGTLTGTLTLAGNPTLPLHAATKAYADLFVPKSGGTMTGPLTLSGPPGSGNVAATKAYVDSTVAAGAFIPISGGTLTAPGNIFIPVGAVFQPGTSQYFQTAGFTIINMENNWRFLYNRANGDLTWQRGSDGAALFGFTGGTGNATALGSMAAANFVTGTGGIVRATLVSASSDDSMAFTIAPGNRIFRFTGDGWQWNWDPTNGNLLWTMGPASAPFVQFRATDNQVVNHRGGFIISSGQQVLASDQRQKTNIATITGALANLMQMRPVHFNWIADNRYDYGFVAQEMQTVMPECVGIAGVELPDGTGGIDDANPTLGIKSYQVISVIVGAVQEVSKGNLDLTTLPTADPHVNGKPWIDTAAGRVVKVSAG